jgi:hypothetical protein
MSDTANAIDLQRFCAGESDLRFYLRAPIAHKGFRYATNGHICVRVAAPEEAETVSEHKVAESASALFDRATNTDYAPLPAFDAAPECTQCDGVGKVKFTMCPDCDGDGFFDHGSHEYQCKECDGEGALYGEGELCECPKCLGTGKRRHFVRMAPGVGYDARYLEWIKALPGVRFAIGTSATGDPKPLPGHFIFDGGEGVLMGMADRGNA